LGKCKENDQKRCISILDGFIFLQVPPGAESRWSPVALFCSYRFHFSTDFFLLDAERISIEFSTDQYY